MKGKKRELSPIQVAGYVEKLGSVRKAAKALGVPYSTLQGILRRGGLGAAPPPERTPETDRLRARIKQLEGELKRQQQAALSTAEVREQIFGLARHQSRPVEWALPLRTPAKRTAGVPIALWSDWHYGETVKGAEVGGVNHYDCAEADRRVRALVKNTLDLCLHHMPANHPGIIVCLAGDFVTGEIHDELTRSNDGDLLPTVLRVVDILAWGLDQLLQVFPHVHVPCVSGNHGRATQKIQHKGFIYKNFDWLIYTLLERHYKDEPRIAFDNPPDNQCFFDVFGSRYTLVHGHDLGVKGGDGIIGVAGPINRGRVKSGLAADSLGQGYDYLLMGHFHTYLPNLHSSGFLVNGSLIGFTEYARDRRYRYQRPVQSLHFHHPEHGPTALWPVFVSDDPTRRARDFRKPF